MTYQPTSGFPAGTQCSRQVSRPEDEFAHCTEPPIAQVVHDGNISYYCSDHYEQHQEWFE